MNGSEEGRDPNSPKEGESGHAEHELEGEPRRRRWLATGGLPAWRAARAFGRWLTKSESGHEGDSEKEEKLRSPAGRLLAEGAEAGWKAVQASAAAMSRVVEEHAAVGPEGALAGEPGRAGDVNLDVEEGVDLQRRARWGTFLVAVAMGAMFAGGAGFLLSYWTGASNEKLGGSLALFLAGAGAALVLWAQYLTLHKEATAPREAQSSSVVESRAAAAVYRSGVADVQRRRLLKAMGIGGTAFAAACAISLLKSMGFAPSTALYTRVWKRGQRLVKLDNTPVAMDSLQPGGMMLVFPENAIGSEKTQTVLVRVAEDKLQLPPERKGWAPQGYLAYSRICTHAGCDVGMYEATTHLLMCPCHQSTFDVLDGAQPTGGPAARPLPQLPLYVDSQGMLRAAGGFSEPPGPGFWGMP